MTQVKCKVDFRSEQLFLSSCNWHTESGTQSNQVELDLGYADNMLRPHRGGLDDIYSLRR